jgi:enoyl-CoA hydratase/carnithine racemase
MALPTHEFLQTYQEDKTLYMTLNRPEKMNALRDDMLQVFCQIVDTVENDDSISVVVVRGNGPCFSSGYDIGPDVEGARPQYSEGSRRFFKRRYAFLDRIWECPKPFIASVHGYCLASASDLANVCDITLAADDAQFGYPAVRWGGHTHRLTYPWYMPIKKAKEMMFTGDRISAVEAEKIGMVNRVVPRADLEKETKALAERIAMIPVSGLIVNKISMNHSYNVRGYREAMQYSFQIAETNLWRQEPFFEKVKSQGLGAALEYRDTKFEDVAEEK